MTRPDPPRLVPEELDPDPICQFREWMVAAVERRLHEPNAMALATATDDGRTSARMVLLKTFDERGFVFSTNYESRKASDLERNPRAALLIYWSSLERQVRIEGRVERTPEQESDAIFRSRPRGARLGAWASAQSRVIPDRDGLEAELRRLDRRWRGEIPRPPHWGGYRVIPEQIEFWQGRPHRLHDRLVYRLADGVWQIDRLAP